MEVTERILINCVELSINKHYGNVCVCRSEESDHELSEVDEEVIPDEVKAWLASTFTKNAPPRPKSLEPRPRFRSVANAIRVGLFVDRFYRQLSSNTLQVPPEVQSIIKVSQHQHSQSSLYLYTNIQTHNGENEKLT